MPETFSPFFFLSPNATKLERKDWGRQLALSLENFRVPAALVAGSALAGAFGLAPAATDTTVVGLCKRLHLLFSVGSFMSSMITVALATSALVQLNDQDSGRDTAAADLEDFVSRAGYSLEVWVAVNAHFIMGLLSLCTAGGLRCWVVGDAFARIATLMIGSGVFLCLSIGLPRSSIGLLSLSYRYLSTILKKAFNLRKPSPFLMLAVLLAVTACGLTVREMSAYVQVASGNF